MGKRFGKALTRLVVGLSAVEKPWRRIDTRLRVIEGLLARQRVETRHGPLYFVTTHPQALQYPREFETREPETLAWIDSFETPCRFWDIGANIGVFSIYAGLRAGIEVRAFEPAAASYGALCRNIEANGLGDRVQAYCVAIGERTELGRLYLSATNAGSVYNAFESTDDCFGNEIAVAFRQGVIGFSIDGFRRLFGLPAPNYLKIDVDSIEERILAGASETLRDPDLRSVLIELEAADTPRNDRLAEALETAGLGRTLRSGRNQGGVVNAIFTRAAARVVAEPRGNRPVP
ncbi:MAG TPA: FkbM family methyltransferase [Stellaceae bacterium]|nr:FkbM family methyltransferase [Stellaceae bacterium]